MGIILAVMSVAVEMFFVVQYEGVRNFLIHHEKFGIFFSFALSFFIGEAFGAHGVIALFAGMTSTVITVIIYNTGALHLVDAYRQNKSAYAAKWATFKDTARGTIVFWAKVISAPYRAYRSVKHGCVRIADSYRRTKNVVLRR